MSRWHTLRCPHHHFSSMIGAAMLMDGWSRDSRPNINDNIYKLTSALNKQIPRMLQLSDLPTLLLFRLPYNHTPQGSSQVAALDFRKTFLQAHRNTIKECTPPTLLSRCLTETRARIALLQKNPVHVNAHTDTHHHYHCGHGRYKNRILLRRERSLAIRRRTTQGLGLRSR